MVEREQKIEIDKTERRNKICERSNVNRERRTWSKGNKRIEKERKIVQQEKITVQKNKNKERRMRRQGDISKPLPGINEAFAGVKELTNKK